MAKRIGNLNAQITADGIQFRAEMVKCGTAAGRFAGDTKKTSDGVIANLEGMLQKGSLGKLATGFGRLTAAVGTAWAAFRAGQAIRAQIEEFFTTGAEKAGEFMDSLTTAGTDPKAEFKAITDEIDRLNSVIAYATEHPLRTAFEFTDAGKAREQVKALTGEATRAFKTVQDLEKAKAAKESRADNAALLKKNDSERLAAQSRFFAERRREEDRLKDLDESIARDKLGILRTQIDATADEGRKLMLRRQAEEMESAIKVAELRRELEEEADADARERIRQRIAMEVERGKAAVDAIKPDEKKPTRETPHEDLKAITRNSAEEARVIFAAAQSATARKRDDEAKRQTRLQEQVVKVLKSIDAHVQTDVEISLL